MAMTTGQSWLGRSSLLPIMAGGFVLVGFAEGDSGAFTCSTREGSLAAWSQDAVHSIIAKYIDPSFQCVVAHPVSSNTGTAHPVIVVPGGHRSPVRAKAGSPDGTTLVTNRVYIRRPGPNSEEPRSSAEWDSLFERCLQNRKTELLEALRSIMEGIVPSSLNSTQTRTDELQEFEHKCIRRWEDLVDNLPPQSPPRLVHGHYDMSFAIEGDFQEQSLRDLKDTIQTATKNHSGWPPFVLIQRKPFGMRPVDDAIECWIGPDSDGSFDRPDHHDFWRISPRGLFFTRRGYSEDAEQDGMKAGSFFDITTPTWRLGEGILQAYYVASALGAREAELICHAKWTGLRNRTLISRGNPRRYISANRYKCAQGDYEAAKVVSVSALPDALPEVVWTMLNPLYQVFDFFDLPTSLVSQELTALRSTTFRA